MKKLLALIFTAILTLGLVGEASANNRYFKNEKHALRVHQRAERDKLNAKQHQEIHNAKISGADLRSLRQRHKEERRKLKAREKAENAQLKIDKHY